MCLMIPKTIHQIWIGNNPPTEWINSFKEKYRGYKHILWDENMLLPFFNRLLFEEQDRGCAKADILRYEILYRYGGVYFDADMVCLKKIPDSFLKDDFFTAYESEKYLPGLVNNAVIGCVAGHPIMREMIQGLKDRDPKLPIWQRFGPGYLTESIKGHDVKIYESRLFHPVHFIDRKKGTEDQERLKEAYVDHKFGSTNI